MCCDDFKVCALFVAVGALVHPLGALILHMSCQLSLLQLHIAAVVVAFHDYIVAIGTGVFVSIPQTPLPLAASFFIGALHLEVKYSSLVEGIWICGEGFAIDRALFNAFNALSTEQVPTTGLHWVRDQLQTDGALELLQKLVLGCLQTRTLLYSFVAVGTHDVYPQSVPP